MTVTSMDLANAVFAALKPNQPVPPPDPIIWPTVMGANWFMPRDWPVAQTDQPIGKIGPPQEVKNSTGKAMANFITTCAIEVIAEVSTTGKDDNDAAGLVLTALGLIQRDIELAIINDPVLFGGDQPALVQELAKVTTKTATNSQGTLARGALSMIFEFNFYQGIEDFQQPTYQTVDRFHIYADLINVADRSGTYNPPMTYTPTPAPREIGPDGRIEGQFEVAVEDPEE